MGEHRTSGGARGISKGPLIAVGTIIVVVLAAFGWFQLRDRIADQGTQAAETCVEGAIDVPVTVEPDISSQITQLAERFTATGPVIRDHCVSLKVDTRNSATIAAALTSSSPDWDTAALGPRPALWIPRSSDAVAGLPSGTVDGTPRSVASSPIVLAVPSEVGSALADADVGWADIPPLQQAGGLDSAGLPGWGGLRLGLPIGEGSDSTTAALAAIASAVSGDTDGALTPERVATAPISGAIAALARTDVGVASTAPDSTDAALARLSGDLSATGAIHAVPVTEQQMLASAQTGLTAYSPSGSTLTADHPAVILGGSWMDETLARAAAQFVEFVRQSDNSQIFVDAGFEVGGEPDRLSASYDTRRALIDAVQNPSTPRRITTLLDVSGSMDEPEGGRTRLGNTVAALTEQFRSAADSTDIGLWVYSKDLDGGRAYRTLVPTGPIAELRPGGIRRDELIAAAEALTPETATSTYESVLAAFADSRDNFSPDRPNRLVLVTDGPNDDTDMTSDRFESMLSASVDPARPVAIDVVSIGTNSDASTLQSMSDMTGGSFTTVSSSDGTELPDLLRKLLY